MSVQPKYFIQEILVGYKKHPDISIFFIIHEIKKIDDNEYTIFKSFNLKFFNIIRAGINNAKTKVLLFKKANTPIKVKKK